MSEVKIKSLADNVFDIIEGKILSGEFKRGEVLTEMALSKSLSVSRTPIREAIGRLTQENLVKESPKGHIVLGLTIDDIIDIYDIRLKIEGVATAMCAKNISKEALQELKEVLDLQEFYTERGEADKIKSADSSFHNIIYSNCGSVIYESLLMGLHRKVQTYRKISVSSSDRAKQAVIEHKEIYDAIKNKNHALAEALTVKHINNAKISIIGK